MNNDTSHTHTRMQTLFSRLHEKSYNAGFRPFDFGVYPDCQTLLAAGEEYRELLSLKAEVERLRVAEKKLKTQLLELATMAEIAIGDHFPPNDCYATGPRTGNPIADLVACPGCALLKQAASVRSTVSLVSESTTRGS